jgi:hypothetical protein
MKTLLMLYMIYLSWGTVGQGRVSFLEMSRYLRRSKTQTKNDLLKLASDGLVDIITLYSDAGAKKHFVQLTSFGDDYLMLNFDAAQLQYHEHVMFVISEIQLAASQAEYVPKRMGKKEIKAIQAGQQKLEGFE